MRKSNYGKRPPMSKKTKKIMAGVIGVGILVALIVFFSYYKVDSVEVRGTDHYTDEEVKSMVLRGPLASNSVLAPLVYSTTNTDDIAYVDGFKVTQLNRNTICISVKEKKTVGCIRYLDSYVYFDRNGIFVEGSQNRDVTVPYFDGIQVNSIVMDEKLDIKGDTVLNTAVALSTIFQKNDMIPDHIQFDNSYSISLIYGDITVNLGKDEDLEEKMNRVIAILPKIQGKKGILHMESVSTDSNTFEEEKEETGITAENWNGGYDEDGNVILDENLVRQYVADLGLKYDTMGQTRTFLTYDNRQVEIKGGDYGWVIDQDEEVKALIAAIESGVTQVREPVYLYSGYSRGTNDIGSTYVEIDLTNQRLVFYQKGTPIVDTPIVSGNPDIEGCGTPTGCYALDAKESPAVLTGEDYEANVTYWMPFAGNVGIHDASWRSEFGGNLYLWEGSHGCVNVPYDKAAEIYANSEVGMPVVVYE